MTDKKHDSLTVLIPAHNEANAIGPVLEELDRTLLGIGLRSKILVVDDGSKDMTAIAAQRARCVCPISVIVLSRNFGKEAAMSAGLAQVDTDAVVIMDADGQHPPELLPQFVQFWKEGYDVVYAKRISRLTDSWLRRTLSMIYYRVVEKQTKFIEPGAGDFRLISSDVVAALNALPERNRFMKGLFNWVGFKKYPIDYVPRARIADVSKYTNFTLLFRFGILGVMSFSTLPLRMISRMGMFVASSAVIYALYIAIHTLIYGTDVPGWATLTVGMALLGGIQLISIGVLGEYIGQIFTEVKNRPLYIVQDVLTGGNVDDEKRADAA